MVFFYAKYDYEAPGVSGGGTWAYGSKPDRSKPGASQRYWESVMSTDKTLSPIKRAFRGYRQERIPKLRTSDIASSSVSRLTSPVKPTVSPTEAQGHFSCIDFASDAYDMLATNSDESIKGLDTKLEHIEHMLTGNLNCQKDLRQYLRNSNESQTRLEATLDLGTQNAKLLDRLNAAKEENTKLTLQIESNEVLKQMYKERIEAAQREHNSELKNSESNQKKSYADLARRYDQSVRQKASAVEKLESLARSVQKLEDEVNGHKAEKSELIRQHGEQVHAIRATEKLLETIGNQQPDKDELRQAHEEQLRQLHSIESYIQGMDARLIDGHDILQRHDEQGKTLETIHQQLDEMGARQLDKENTTQRYEEQVKALDAIEKRLEELHTHQLKQGIDPTKYEEQIKALQAIEKRLEELGGNQLDKESASFSYEEQLKSLNKIAKRLEDMDARQLEREQAAAVYEEQMGTLSAVRKHLQEIDARQLSENFGDKFQEQISALTVISKRLEEMDARQFDKDIAASRYQEHIEALNTVNKALEEIKLRQLDTSADDKHQEQMSTLTAMAKRLDEMDSRQLDKDSATARYKEHSEGLNTVKKYVEEMNARQLNENTSMHYQEQSEGLATVKKYVEEMNARQLDENASTHYQEHSEGLATVKKYIEEMNARQLDENTGTHYQEQARALDVIGKKLEGIEGRQLDKEHATSRHEEQVGILQTVNKRLEEMDSRQLGENSSARYQEQIDALNKISNSLEEIDARHLDKEHAIQNHEEEVKILEKIEGLLAGMNSQEDIVQNQKQQNEAIAAIENVMKDLDERQPDKEYMDLKHQEQIQELKSIGNFVRELNAQEPLNGELERSHQKQMEALDAIEGLVKGIGTHDFSGRHEEQIRSLTAIENLIKDAHAQQNVREELTRKHEEQLKRLHDLESEFKTQIEKVEIAVHKLGSDQHGKENLDQKHQEVLQALERNRQVEPDPELQSQLVDIHRLLQRIEEQQKSAELAITESVESNVLSSENAALLSSLQQQNAELRDRMRSEREEYEKKAEQEKADLRKTMREETTELQTRVEAEKAELRAQYEREKAELAREREEEKTRLKDIHEQKEMMAKDMENQAGDMVEKFRHVTERFQSEKRAHEVTTRALEEAKSEKELLERSQASWMNDKNNLEIKLASIGAESTQAKSQVERLQSEKDRMKLDWEEEKAKMALRVEELKKKTDIEEERRGKLFEQVQTLRGNIRVMCRVRPPLPDTPQEQLVDFHPKQGEFVDHYQKIEVISERATAAGGIRQSSKFLECERIFTADDTNNDVFDEISQLTMSALSGKKVSVFCYGQTGSGKTFTMNHKVSPGRDDPNDGIIHRSVALMFENINEMSEYYTYTLNMSVVEVYINDLIDLCAGHKRSIIKNIDEATLVSMKSKEDVSQKIETALDNRAVGATNANAASSRSHLIICFKIKRTQLKGPAKGNEVVGILNLIDLAGSEKAKETGATGQRLEESKAINGSIFELNQTITALAEGRPKRPGHTLTRVLEPCLAKGSRVVMFVMVSPLKKDQPETENTMSKAEMAAKAKLNSRVTLSPTSPGRSNIPVLQKPPVDNRRAGLSKLTRR